MTRLFEEAGAEIGVISICEGPEEDEYKSDEEEAFSDLNFGGHDENDKR